MITEVDVRAAIAKTVPHIDASVVSAQALFQTAGMDSLDHFNILFELETKHGLVFSGEDIAQLSSIQQIVEFSNRAEKFQAPI